MNITLKGVCAICLGSGFQARYTTVEAPAPSILSTSGHLAIAPVCTACNGTGKGSWR